MGQGLIILESFMRREAQEESTYYGIGKFVEASDPSRENLSSNLHPGTLTKDDDYERMIEPGSQLQGYITEAFNQSVSQSKIEHFTRFFGIVLQWIKALLTKADRNFELKSKMGRLMKEAKVTEEMLKNIDNPNGKGSMVLVRLLSQKEGEILVQVLRDVRDALGLGNRFCVSLDDQMNRDLCEWQFLPRLRAWYDDQDYMPKSYTELKDLPVILVVVEKGKMGITYPKSLRYYDLRLRYYTATPPTRSAMEQDFGRACRYECDGDPPLPTVIVSKPAEQQLHDVRKLRQKAKNKATGVYKLLPDYPKYMKPSGRKKETPESDSDLVPYQKWRACGKHWDVGNTSRAQNRYLLVGRPQIGKTGVFLHLARLLWEEIGKPEFTSPTSEMDPIVELEQPEEDDDEEEIGDPPADLKNMDQFPDFNIMKEMNLERCRPSPRYGDPYDPKVQHHYLEEGKQYPYPGALRCGNNSLMERKDNLSVKPLTSQVNGSSGKEARCRTTVKVVEERVRNKFCSKAIEIRETSEKKPLSELYQRIPIGDLGVLHLRNSCLTSKWETSKGVPKIKGKIKLPPILIPSSGRSKIALLDLRDAMEGEKNYVEIVVVREEEQDEYFNSAIHHPALDVFVMKSLGNDTIGEARMLSKKLGEQITADTGQNFLFLLDDNILFWNGVTLINDPCALFQVEANNKTSQRTDISLFRVLNHFSSNSFEKVKDFNILGFSIGTHKSINRRRLAYGRKHVAAAVLINLQKSRTIDYNPKAWAMEDIDFNLRTNKLSSKNPDEGVIVKCLRFVACKKKLREGGVLPCDVPEDVMQLMQETPEWEEVKTRRGKHRKPQEEGKVDTSRDKEAVKPPNSTTKNLTPEQRQQIIKECVEDLISPTDLARKWNCNADTIRTWVRKAGLTLPKQYKCIAQGPSVYISSEKGEPDVVDADKIKQEPEDADSPLNRKKSPLPTRTIAPQATVTSAKFNPNQPFLLPTPNIAPTSSPSKIIAGRGVDRGAGRGVGRGVKRGAGRGVERGVGRGAGRGAERGAGRGDDKRGGLLPGRGVGKRGGQMGGVLPAQRAAQGAGGGQGSGKEGDRQVCGRGGRQVNGRGGGQGSGRGVGRGGGYGDELGGPPQGAIGGEKSKNTPIVKEETGGCDGQAQKSLDIMFIIEEAGQIPVEEKRLQDKASELKVKKKKLQEEMRKLEKEERQVLEESNALEARKRKFNELKQAAGKEQKTKEAAATEELEIKKRRLSAQNDDVDFYRPNPI